MGKRLCSMLLLVCLLFNSFAGINVFAVEDDQIGNIGVEGLESILLETDTDQNSTVTEAIYGEDSSSLNGIMNRLALTTEGLDDVAGHITVSVEKFTLGQGYIIEPIQVPFYEGDNGAKIITDLLTEYLGENSYENTGSIESGFYLSRVRDNDTSDVNVPQYILDQIGGGLDGRSEEGWLGEFDYNFMSGWMYAVNGWFPNVGFSDYFPEDGDVVRVQFTLYGYGADLGAISDWGFEPFITVANKDALMAKIGEINSDPNKWEILSNPKAKIAYDMAYEVLMDLESPQDHVDEALLALNDALAGGGTEEKVKIVSITPVTDITVAFGTSQANAIASLAERTTITDNENKTHVVSLNWVIEGYNGNQAGEYTAIATFDLPEGVNQAEPAIELKVQAKVTVAEKNPNEAIQSVKEHLEKSLAYIYKNTPDPTLGTGGGEWSILALARGGYQVSEGYYDLYYNNVVDRVKALMPASGSKPANRLDRNKGTEHSRLILGLTAIGKDITDVGGYDISAALADYNYVIRQGINGPIFALIALDSHNYEIPTKEEVAKQSTRDMFIDYILEKEIKKGTEEAGGWALSGSVPDPDITSMAIQGLTPYYEKRADVKVAVDRAITWLSNAQKEDGGFASWGSVNSESIAQVIVALTGLKIDPHTDPRFIKNGNSALDALLSYAVPDGGFMHVKPGGNTGGGAEAGVVDGMATDQGTYALVAYNRFVEGKTSLYDMSDVKLETEIPVDPEQPEEPKNEIKLPEGEKPKVEIPADENDYNIIITKDDSNKEITIEIPADKNSKVTVGLPLNESLPEIKVTKGTVSAVFPKDTKVVGGDATAFELITWQDHTDDTIKDKVTSVIPGGENLKDILQVITMGGSSRIEFSDFITLTFAGMKGKDAAYIQNGVAHKINQYSSDSEGKQSGAQTYTYDSGEDLIVKTKHFTDYVIYTAEATTSPGNGGGGGANPEPKKYITLSIDKLTINKGYVLRPVKVEFKDGESVWDVLKREMDNRGIQYTYVWTPKYNSVYVEWIAGDGEFDHGSGSGWMYNVNGWYPNYGASLYKLEDGDVVQWRYTTNLGADLGEDITKWDQPKITVRGLKQNQTVAEEALSFEVTAVDSKGKSLTPTVKHNGDTISGSKGKYEVTLKKGKNTIVIIAVDADGNRAEETFTVTYTPSDKENKNKPVNQNNSTRENGTPTVSDPKHSAGEKGNTNGVVGDLSKAYSDASAISSWALEAINRATQKGFISGSNNKFNPKANITRAEFTKIIVSILGLKLEIDKDINFVDVKENQWFYPYVNAAYRAGIIMGNGNQFNPNDHITREQMAAMIVRALGIKPIKANTTIRDLDKVSDWAKVEVETAVALGLMVGDEGVFDPKAFATREMATVVAMRSYDYKNNHAVEAVNTTQEIKETKEAKGANVDVKNQIQETANYMQKTITDPIVASIGGEWTVFGLARSGVKVPEQYYEKYYANLEKTLKEKAGILHRIKYTEYDRVILALTAIGRNVKDVAGYDLTKPLADFNAVIKQGINGPIFALIALDSNNYEIPLDATVKVQTTRQALIDFILGREIKGGGWALGENPPEADPDITAMAIQSLAPYYEKDEKVKAAVDRGVAWLSKVQKGDGGFASWGSVNSESIAQVIVALTSLGIDPHNDPRFIKNGKSAVDALLSFAVPGGGFYHIKPGGKGNGGANPGEVDAMATDQAMYALVAYDRFINGQNRLYDMTDVKK